MMTEKRGGKREGAGRKKGGVNAYKRDWPSKTLKNHNADQDQTPVEFLTDVMRDPEIPLEQRIRVARDLLPYFHAKIMATTEKKEDLPSQIKEDFQRWSSLSRN